MKSLPNEAFNENIPDGPLNFAAHINEGKYFMYIFPNEGPNIAHNAHAINSGFYRKVQHLEGPILEQSDTFYQTNNFVRG